MLFDISPICIDHAQATDTHSLCLEFMCWVMNTSATYAILPMIYANLTLHRLLSCCFKCIWYLPNGAEHNCQYNLIYQIDVLFGPFGTHQLNPFASFNPFDNAVITQYLQFSLLLAHTTPIAGRCLLWLHFMLTHIRINVDVVVERVFWGRFHHLCVSLCPKGWPKKAAHICVWNFDVGKVRATEVQCVHSEHSAQSCKQQYMINKTENFQNDVFNILRL